MSMAPSAQAYTAMFTRLAAALFGANRIARLRRRMGRKRDEEMMPVVMGSEEAAGGDMIYRPRPSL